MRTAATIILALIGLTFAPAVAHLATAAGRATVAALTSGPAAVAAFIALATAALLGLLWTALGEPPEPKP